MNRYLHTALITFYSVVTLAALIVLVYVGHSYYRLPIEERFFHPMYEMLKPSGYLGHGFGTMGTLLILIGLFSYMARKHLRIFWGWGLLKHWLEFHIFLCTLGTLLVVFHTTFKFGGLVSIGFWSLIIVWFSGLIGRFIYIQIPRSLEGQMLSLQDIKEKIENLEADLKDVYDLDFLEIRSLSLFKLRRYLKMRNLKKNDYQLVRQHLKEEKQLLKRMKRLEQMKRIFNRWHYAHLPFALIMLLIMVIHVSVVLYLGYKWIF